MNRSDEQLEQWFIECFYECDTIDAMEDAEGAVEALCELVGRINKAYGVFPQDQLVRCCEMAAERLLFRH
tara:strand:- start:600 stop:809 length:210 start_codon:yes stop_codon:yes gene_type:complete